MIHPALNVLQSTLALGMPGTWEWVIVLVLALLFFGRRLPEVGRSLGKGIVEFKRGIRGITDEIEDESSHSGSRSRERDEDRPRELPRRTADPVVSRADDADAEPAEAEASSRAEDRTSA